MFSLILPILVLGDSFKISSAKVKRPPYLVRQDHLIITASCYLAQCSIHFDKFCKKLFMTY